MTDRKSSQEWHPGCQPREWRKKEIFNSKVIFTYILVCLRLSSANYRVVKRKRSVKLKADGNGESMELDITVYMQTLSQVTP